MRWYIFILTVLFIFIGYVGLVFIEDLLIKKTFSIQYNISNLIIKYEVL